MLKTIKQLTINLLFRFTGGNHYTYHKGVFFSAPSLRQLKILKSYLRADRNFQNREDISTSLIKMVAKNNPVILDVGGNIGYSAIHYSRVLEQIDGGQCFTFEPYKPNFKHIIRNVNHFDNIFPITFGLSNYSGIVDFGIPEYLYKSSKSMNNTGFVSYKGLGVSSINTVKGVLIRGDELEIINTESLNIVYIKIDTEGSEPEVVEGLLGVIRRQKPFIQIEYNPNTMEYESIRKIYYAVKEVGYNLFSDNPLTVNSQCELYFIPDEHCQKVKSIRQLCLFDDFE